MPLESGSSPTILGRNIRELHKGPQYARTKAKHGAAVANAQAIAIAEKKKRESTILKSK
jgi:hypothetical protein